MAITHFSPSNRLQSYYTGLSTDVKPTTGVSSGALFLELDTTEIFQLVGGFWRLTSEMSDPTSLLMQILSVVQSMATELHALRLGLVLSDIVTDVGTRELV